MIILLLIVLPLLVNASERLQPPTNVRISYQSTTEKVHVRWNKVTGADDYQVQIIRKSNGRRIKNSKTKQRDWTFAAHRLINGANYTIRVRALPQSSQYRVSRWAKTTYRHQLPEPRFTTTLEPTIVSHTNLWLFVVDDQQDQLAASAEAGGEIIIGRIDLNNATTLDAADWTAVLTAADTGGENISDHWHIYAHGYHWIVASTSGASKSILAKINSDFTVEAVTTVVENKPGVYTNDMFLVAEKTGVAVGHFLPGFGHRIFRFNTAAELVDTVRVGGGEYTHGNGASVLATNDGYMIVAPTTLNPAVASDIVVLRLTSAWQERSIETILSKSGANFAMPTVVPIAGHYLVTVRLRTELSDQSTGSDAGSIRRYVFDETWDQRDRTTLQADTGNRPHTVLVDDTQLITTWDGEGSGWIQVDEVE